MAASMKWDGAYYVRLTNKSGGKTIFNVDLHKHEQAAKAFQYCEPQWNMHYGTWKGVEEITDVVLFIGFCITCNKDSLMSNKS